MPDDDRARWNDRYRDLDPLTAEPSRFVRSLAALLPASGRALDVAGGPGADAVWLAEQGLDTTVVDVSDVALAGAHRRAAQHGVELRTIVADLEVDPLPPGRWDVVLCRHYLQRDLFPALVGALAPGGLLCVCIATTTNLERHARPPARFLLEPGEALRLVAGLEPVRFEEGWSSPGPDGHHEARLVARRPGDSEARRSGGAARLDG